MSHCNTLVKTLLAAGLAGKEHSNPQFMFLKPTHSMFGFFTSLCDAYSRVLMPDKGLMQKLQKDAEDRSALLHSFLGMLLATRAARCCSSPPCDKFACLHTASYGRHTASGLLSS